jgi:hypothetical protein
MMEIICNRTNIINRKKYKIKKIILFHLLKKLMMMINLPNIQMEMQTQIQMQM